MENKNKYLIKKLKFEYGVYIKRIKMKDSGNIYIAYTQTARDICVFREPISDKIYYSLEEILIEVENKKNESRSIKVSN